MRNVFWIGLYPGLTEEMLDYTLRTIGDFIETGGNPLRVISSELPVEVAS